MRGRLYAGLLGLLALALLAGPLPWPAHASGPPDRGLIPGVYVQDDWESESLRFDWAAGSAAEVGWRQLEPVEGHYDFGRVDAWLELLGRGGKAGALSILLRCGDDESGRDACAPEWALAWDPVLAAGRPRLNYLDARVRGRGIWSPPWLSTTPMTGACPMWSLAWDTKARRALARPSRG